MRAFTRRDFLQTGGALVVAFAWRQSGKRGDPPALQEAVAGARGTSGASSDPALDQLDSWLAVGADGSITLYSGKVELGTGVETALSQIVAEELDVPIGRVTVIQGSTGLVPDQGYTAGSRTLQSGGVQIRQAAATARQALLALAAARLGAPASALAVRNGTVFAGARSVSYAELTGGRHFARAVDRAAPLKQPSAYTTVGRAVRRVELPAKVYGTHVYVHNVRVPGMLHGRVVRPTAIGATLGAIDDHAARAIPGVVDIVQRANFVGVVAVREENAIEAARALDVTWTPPATPLPSLHDMYDAMHTTASRERVLTSIGNVDAPLADGARQLQATYFTPYQSHGSIGPSCAVADVRDDEATVWSGTQGSYALRDALAELLGVAPERVRVVWTEASGCYGHNGADDAAADAALLSQAVHRPVRVQWSRADELGWDPKSPAMRMDVRGAVDARGRVVVWDYAVTTPTHSTRPGGHAGNLLAGQLLGLTGRSGFGGGDRNARHNYIFPADRVVSRQFEHGPLRPSAMRGLGAPANLFATESFMDELAAVAHVDPIQFRLGHLQDPRGIAVIQRVAELSGWEPRPSPRRIARAGDSAMEVGRGIAFAQYENQFAYIATIAEVEVHPASGRVRVRRACVAFDCGLIVNPDGLRNQIEGATIQGISRALLEAVRYDDRAVTSVDWKTYPILAFPDVPDTVEVALLNHPDQPAWGAGEPATCTVAGAIANAIFDATGARVRAVPFTPERVRAALS
jgi:CO/xanthine dehydrogenase Mo-binding subunit